MPLSKVHPSPFWADCATTYFRALQASGAIGEVVAVLPVAATEQHGPHLPLKVDSAIVDGVIEAAIAHLPTNSQALFLPTQAIGFSPEHARFAGTLTLKAETVLRVWTELAESVAATGVRKLLIFNAHGGQANLMDLVARDLRARLDMMVFSVNWYALPLTTPQGEDISGMFSAEEQRFGVHAGDLETSMMLAIDPGHVNMATAANFPSTAQLRASNYTILGNGKTAKFAWQMQDYNPDGAAGNAAAATSGKGQAVVDAAGRALAALLSEIERLSMSTLNNVAN
jgi:creatinine amidohydrolase